MSWDQGIQPREDIPEPLLKIWEDKYEASFGERRQVEYITWFGLGEEVFIDFGTPGKCLVWRDKE